jgi:hypothetical protein
MTYLTHIVLSFVSGLHLFETESQFNNMRFRTATLLHGCQAGNNVISRVRNPHDRKSGKNT